MAKKVIANIKNKRAKKYTKIIRFIKNNNGFYTTTEEYTIIDDKN
jgi:hypothetical protein